MRFRAKLSVRPNVSKQPPPSKATLVAIALLMVGIGLYFSLIGMGVVPVPGGPRNLHAPLWVVLCAGLTFLLGGLAFALNLVAGGDPETGELPPDAPQWVPVARYLIGLAIFACFAFVGSWIAFGPGERSFSGTVPVGAIGGRIVFGIGAVILWLCTVAYAVAGARKLMGRAKPSPS
jgi:hypothetical protein